MSSDQRVSVKLYLNILTLEKVSGPQDEVLGKVNDPLTSPQYLDRERVGEDTA